MCLRKYRYIRYIIQLWTLDADGNPVEYLAATLETGAYGVVQLDVGDGPFDDLLGCTDPIASNTDSDALWDDDVIMKEQNVQQPLLLLLEQMKHLALHCGTHLLLLCQELQQFLLVEVALILRYTDTLEHVMHLFKLDLMMMA